VPETEVLAAVPTAATTSQAPQAEAVRPSIAEEPKVPEPCAPVEETPLIAKPPAPEADGSQATEPLPAEATPAPDAKPEETPEVLSTEVSEAPISTLSATSDRTQENADSLSSQSQAAPIVEQDAPPPSAATVSESEPVNPVTEPVENLEAQIVYDKAPDPETVDTEIAPMPTPTIVKRKKHLLRQEFQAKLQNGETVPADEPVKTSPDLPEAADPARSSEPPMEQLEIPDQNENLITKEIRPPDFEAARPSLRPGFVDVAVQTDIYGLGNDKSPCSCHCNKK
jgi:hypothetical protein